MIQPALQAQQLSYFGKIPSRGDFVKGSYNPQLFKILDGWLSQAMELLAEDARWKSIYDSAPPMRFVCLGSRSKLVIAGCVLPSHDAAQRRYPFVTAMPLEVERPSDFMAGAPLLLQDYWRLSGSAAEAILAGADDKADLRQLEDVSVPITPVFQGSDEHAAYQAFVRSHSLLRLEQLLNGDGRHVSVRRVILALGMLLQPVMASGVSHLEKGLTLPLPRDPQLQGMVATLWLDFISRFLGRADFELAVFICHIESRPRLVVGFSGLAAKSLQSVIHPQAYLDQNIEIDDAEWVEDGIHNNYAMYKLVSYLEQPQLPLDIIITAFREVFIGE